MNQSSISLAYHTITWRDDISGALRDIARAGFTAFEMFSFPPRPEDTWSGYVARLTHAYRERPEAYLETGAYTTPEELTILAASHGLTLTSMYCSGLFIDPALKVYEIRAILAAARFVRAAGGRHLILGGGMNGKGVYENGDYLRLFDMLHTLGQACREIGVQACYHPHSGTMVETAEQLDFFCRETEPDLIHLAPDVAHLVRGGADPVAVIRRYSDRIRYMHLKDIRDNEFVELGEGHLDMAAVIATLKEIEYAGWAVVELDDTTRTPYDSAVISRQWLDEHL